MPMPGCHSWAIRHWDVATPGRKLPPLPSALLAKHIMLNRSANFGHHRVSRYVYVYV